MIGGPAGRPAQRRHPRLSVRCRAPMVTPRAADSVEMPLTASNETESDGEWRRLMAAAQPGDRAAYERLLRDILPFIRAIVARQHRTRDRVEDAVQDVLLTLHRVRHTYDPSRPFTHWLATLAKRRAIDARRRRGGSAGS